MKKFKLNILLPYLLIFVTFLGCKDKIEPKVDLNTVIQLNIQTTLKDTLYLYSDYQEYAFSEEIALTPETITRKIQTPANTGLGYINYNGVEYPLFLHKGDTITVSKAKKDSTLHFTGNSEYNIYSTFLDGIRNLTKERQIQDFTRSFIVKHPTSTSSIYLLKKYILDVDSLNQELVNDLLKEIPGYTRDQYYLENYESQMTRLGRSKRGDAALYFNLKNIKGDKRDLNKYKNNTYILAFWSSWDSLSIYNNNQLKKLYNKMKRHKDFKIVGISLDNDTLQLKNALKKGKYHWEQLYDPAGFEASVADRYGITQIPTYFIINNKNKIIYRTNSVDSILKFAPELYNKEKKRLKK